MESIKKVGEALKEKVEVTLTGTSAKVTTPTWDPNAYTRATGCPFASMKSLTAGPHGPIVLSDVELLEKILHFNREKIPARNVHALGTGAYGTFTVTNDITRYSKADLFSRVGKTTDLFSRFSGVFTEQGDPDTMRDARGFALKFYTDEGNWDLLSINTPIFLVRDPKMGPDAIHAMKRDPRTGMLNPTQSWDFIANHPEGLHQAAMLYTDESGTPASYRTMNYYGGNTYSLVNASKERFWVRFHLVSQQGLRGFNLMQSKIVSGEDPSFLARDLHESIETKKYPKWTLSIQVMTEEEGYLNPFTFDCTKVWKHTDYPLIEIGTIEINKNPVNYFSEVEQVAFSPATIVPGIGFSPDKLLQGRLLIYDDTQTHRIGPNFKQLYINRPRIEPQNDYYGGNMNLEIKEKLPHYYPSSLPGALKPNEKFIDPPMRGGDIGIYDYPGEGTADDYYGQVIDFWNVLTEIQRNNMCENIAASLYKVTDTIVIDKMLMHFRNVSPKWAQMVEQKLRRRKEGTGKSESEKLLEKYNFDLLNITPISMQ